MPAVAAVRREHELAAALVRLSAGEPEPKPGKATTPDLEQRVLGAATRRPERIGAEVVER